MIQSGRISVQTENIFPIIKKFLYSDHEIFLRELIANATDATSKLKTLARRGEFTEDLGDITIEVIIDEAAKTLTIRDKGIGMTEEEVKKYLNQVAFSSAKEFLEKYQNDASIIGHFGLGFYSAFMVASQVDVLTRSYKNEPAVKWSCQGDTEYTIEPIEKEQRGTEIVLHINEEDKEFLERSRIESMLNKYCKFLPVEIQFGTRSESKELEEQDEEGNPLTETVEVPNIINNPSPAWNKNPLELTDQDYLDFYQELHPYSAEPLFWVHLNIDYPFNLTGILYFPKLGNQIEIQRNKIQLYSNQVYVTDEVKEIVPEFLTLLHGVIDSPDIPLNVSRSYLQSDRNVKKITEYITRKVADKLDELFRKERETYESKWENISVFVKYGYVTEEKFAEKAEKFCLLQNTDDELFTIADYKEKIKEKQTNKENRLVVLYTNQPEAHDLLISQAKEEGYDVLKLDTLIDLHFIQTLERKDSNLTFSRIDADTLGNLIKKEDAPESVLSEEESKQVEELFKAALDKGQATIKLEALSPKDLPVLITRPEFMRRMREMSAAQAQGRDMPEFYNVVVNTNHPLVAKLAKEQEPEKVQHLIDLAHLQQGMLHGAKLSAFLKKSLSFLD